MNDWILQISSGTGPVEVRSFVAQLAARLADYVTAQGLSLEGVIYYGEQKTPRTVQLHVLGDAGALGAIAGTYVLVARSAARRRHSRKRWFAGVQLFAYEVLRRGRDVNEADVAISTARSGGPGGQHVNCTASAVRAVHRPTNISVRVTSERSQYANRKRALALIKQALAERYTQQRQDAQRRRRHHHYELVRGNAIKTFRHDRRGRLVEVTP